MWSNRIKTRKYFCYILLRLKYSGKTYLLFHGSPRTIAELLGIGLNQFLVLCFNVTICHKTIIVAYDHTRKLHNTTKIYGYYMRKINDIWNTKQNQNKADSKNKRSIMKYISFQNIFSTVMIWDTTCSTGNLKSTIWFLLPFPLPLYCSRCIMWSYS